MGKSVVKIENVSKAAGSRQLLDSVSFEIAAQSLVSLIGPNGAGKSTLVKIILGLDPDYTGTVAVAPEERIQYIPQLSSDDRYQLPLSVAEYLSIGSTPLYSQQKSATDFTEALAHVGVPAESLHQPFGSLSGGERQRVAIARALLPKPTILVLDESLAAVDYGSRQGLYELIRHLQKDHHMTVLLVSHDIESILPLSDQILCLNQTLHTDCHPTDLKGDIKSPQQLIHHHC
jgi:zinc transport system ATP-binding protein